MCAYFCIQIIEYPLVTFKNLTITSTRPFHISTLKTFLCLMYNIPFYGYTMPCLTSFLLMDI